MKKFRNVLLVKFVIWMMLQQHDIWMKTWRYFQRNVHWIFNKILRQDFVSFSLSSSVSIFLIDVYQWSIFSFILDFVVWKKSNIRDFNLSFLHSFEAKKSRLKFCLICVYNRINWKLFFSILHFFKADLKFFSFLRITSILTNTKTKLFAVKIEQLISFIECNERSIDFKMRM